VAQQVDNKIVLIYKEISDGSGCKVIYEEGLPNIRGNAQIFNHKREGHLSYKTLQPIPSEFPYIRGKFYFFFIRVPVFNSVAHILKPLLISMKEGKQSYVASTV
jgi:hypothetical protein